MGLLDGVQYDPFKGGKHRGHAEGSGDEGFEDFGCGFAGLGGLGHGCDGDRSLFERLKV